MDDGLTGAKEEKVAKREDTSAGDSADAEWSERAGVQHQDAHAAPQ